MIQYFQEKGIQRISFANNTPIENDVLYETSLSHNLLNIEHLAKITHPWLEAII